MNDDERLLALEKLAKDRQRLPRREDVDRSWRLHRTLSYWVFQAAEAQRAVVDAKIRNAPLSREEAERAAPILQRRDEVLEQLSVTRGDADVFLETGNPTPRSERTSPGA